MSIQESPLARGSHREAADFLSGGGEMGALMRSIDWSATPIGAPSSWPQSLCTSVSTCLNSRFPILLWWGPELVMLYNDAYRRMLGTDKHPRAMGAPGRSIWPEIWDIIGPMLERVFTRGAATWSEDQMLPLDRRGYVEECYFTYSYSPIRDESGGIGGIFTAVTETTERVFAERGMRTLHQLGVAVADVRRVSDAGALCMRVLEGNRNDIPFALLYLLEEGKARLAAAAGVEVGSPAAPGELTIDGDDQLYPLQRVAEGEAELIRDLAARLGAIPTPRSAWGDAVKSALILPIPGPTHPDVGGALVLGVNPRRALEESYRDFLQTVAGTVSTALASARAYEEAEARAEALAELDRAKTTFFSNVSHEFRTPLTLMLGPVEDLLAGKQGPLAPAQQEELEVAHRNSLRLLKLVNVLLDFSRIEAGRMRAAFQPTDLAAYTAELASTFRSAIERAGLKLTVSLEPLPEPVYVDREMWEKIVFNLLSNALKFTFEGEIAVALRPVNQAVQLEIRDTGVGIAPDELPHVFERFHRVRGSAARTYEGTGIGLALVRELAGLHGGTVSVDSSPDRGSTFRVRIPTGTTHLPSDRIETGTSPAAARVKSSAYVEEALRWLPGVDEDELDAILTEGAGEPAHAELSTSPAASARILLADDNADMRGYVKRLLEAHGYTVQAVADGAAALEALHAHPPDLVLSDVMMPRMDGFQLLRNIRADPRVRDVPIVLLSARAGEESRIEGVQAGADDYLVKPFSARELLARVGAHLQLARVRQEAAGAVRESETLFRAMVTATADVMYRMSPDWTEMRFLDGQEFVPDTLEPSRSWVDRYLPLEERERVKEAISRAIATRSLFELEHRVVRVDGSIGWVFSRAVPIVTDTGEIREWFGAATDVTARHEAEEALRLHTEQFERLLEGAPFGVYLVDRELRIRHANPIARAMFGDPADPLGRGFEELAQRVWAPAPAGELVSIIRHTLETGESHVAPERREERRDGREEVLEWRIDRLLLPDGQPGVVCYFRDVSAQVQARWAVESARAEAEEANRAKATFLATMSHELRTPLNAIIGYADLLDAQIAGPLTEGQHTQLERIELGARHLLQIIEEILTFSRIEAGREEVRLEEVDVSDLVRETCRLIEPLAAQKQIGFVCVIAPDVRAVSDPGKVRQILLNLLSNAVKFTEQGEVRVEMLREEDDFVLRVSDTGIGIAAAEQERIFTPFSQVQQARTRRAGGTGLGLTVTRQLSQLLGGDVSVSSVPGEGSSFTVRLPQHPSREGVSS